MLGPGDLVLCGGTLLRASLRQKAEAALAGGFRALTLWPHDYQGARAAGTSDAELRRLLVDHGLVIEALEPLLTWLPEERALAARSPAGAAGEEDFYRIADALGATVLVAAQAFGRTLDLERAAAALAGVAERAARHGLRVCLEFLPWSGIPDAATAHALALRSGHPGVGVLVDTWHCFRGATGPDQIRALPGDAIGGIQLGDAPAAAPADPISESMEGRRLPGDGDAPLLEMLRALRATGTRAPLGVEVFSSELDALEPVEVGRRAGAAVRRLLARAAAALALVLAAPGARAEHVWLELATPSERGLVREPYGLVEIRGTAGTGLPGHHDVAIAIDLSGSTWEPSGADVDGDRITGRIFRTQIPGESIEQLTDPDDSILSAQLGAARRFVERLDATTRMGIVVFAGSEQLLAPVGTPRAELLQALAGLASQPRAGGTYFYGGLMAAVDALLAAPPGDAARQRSIILLSDGLPNQPAPLATAEKAALRAAQNAARAGIRIYAFALGPQVVQHPGVFRALTETSGGELLLVDQPAEVLDFLPHLSLTHLDRIEVENLTTGAAARAVRLFPDGSFDAWAPLARGPNRLRIVAIAQSGARASLEREVRFERIEDARRHELLIEALRERTLETELAAEARRKRELARRRTLEISVER